MFTRLAINKFGSCTNNDEEAFMIRYIILRTKWLKIFIHVFKRSDEGSLHSHPFNLLSFMLKGSYVEEIYNPKGNIFLPRKVLSVLFRDAYSFHRIKLTDNQPITLCFAWSAGKNWHYMDGHTEVKWRKYIKKRS